MQSQEKAPILLWFRNDLRLRDHVALSAAVDTGRPILPVYVEDDETCAPWRLGPAQRQWRAAHLVWLDQQLRQKGSRLLYRRGPAASTVGDLAEEIGAAGVFFSRHYEPWSSAEEQSLADRLKLAGIACRRFSGTLLQEPESVRTKGGRPFRIFTPFYKAYRAREASFTPPLPEPCAIAAPRSWPDAADPPQTTTRNRGLLDLCRHNTGVEAALGAFLENDMSSYAEYRDRPDLDATSRLSPQLRVGAVSVRQIWHAATQAAAADPAIARGVDAFLRQLVWREFSYHLLYHWPHMTSEPFNPMFRDFPWQGHNRALSAWQDGQTGYPLVDAGMRQLRQTGWMHNRVRMVVASFLTKHLLVPWQDGARWFWDHLVDADLANNSVSWQWVAGCGADPAPYFRVFNPILQAQKFDPAGDYVRRWVPELAHLPAKVIQAPWRHKRSVDGYPAPIVEHRFARDRALGAYSELQQRYAA